MAFKGFNVEYPKYSVILPQTKEEYTIRTLNVNGEEVLKGSLVTPKKITEHLNQCIFNSLVDKPKDIKDFETFLKKVTIKDRDALLYGLYHVSYEEIRNYIVKCSACKKEYPVTVPASSTFNMNMYDGQDDILKKRETVELQVTKGVSCIIRQPSLKHEIDSLNVLLYRPGMSLDTIIETLIVDKFVQGDVIYDDREDIVDAYLSLPARDKRQIQNKYFDSFGKYCITLKMQTYCTSCSNKELIDIDLVEQFFRMVFSG